MLLVGLGVGSLLGLVTYVVLLAIPWGYENADHFDEVVVGPLAGLVFGGLVLYTISKEARHAARYEPWALVSAWFSALAFLLGFCVSETLAAEMWWDGGMTTWSRNGFWIVLGLFGSAFLTAGAAALRMGRSVQPRRGWVFVVWGLFMPLWFGGVIAHFVLYPLAFVDPTLLERSLPEMEGAHLSSVDARFYSPLLVVDADGRLWHEGKILDDAALPWTLDDWASRMPWQLDPEVGEPRPDHSVRLYAAADAEYARVAWVLRRTQESDIWKVHIGVRRIPRSSGA